MADRETINVYNEHAEAYTKLLPSQKPHPTLLRFIDLVKPGGRVLDLGCGPGKDAAAMQEQNLEVDAIDASEEMVKLAKEMYDVDARVAIFDEIRPPAAYDGIWANFSLLHLQPNEFRSPPRDIEHNSHTRRGFPSIDEAW